MMMMVMNEIMRHDQNAEDVDANEDIEKNKTTTQKSSDEQDVYL